MRLSSFLSSLFYLLHTYHLQMLQKTCCLENIILKFREPVHEADKIREFRVPKVKRLLLQMKRPFLIRSERETQFNFGGVFPRNRALRTSDTFHNLNPTRRIPSSCSLTPPPPNPSHLRTLRFLLGTYSFVIFKSCRRDREFRCY